MFSNSQFTVQYNQFGRYIAVGNERQQPALILLHGMFGGLSNFDQLLNRINPQKYYVVVPELPLFSLRPEKASIKNLSTWLDAFLQSLNITKVHLLGNSMGGHIALDYAHNHRESVEKLILTGSSGLIENNLGDSSPKRNDRSYIKKQAKKTFFKNMVDDNMVDEIEDILSSSKKLINIIHFARDTHQYNMANMLPDIAHETLLIWGRQDAITPPEAANQFYNLLPNATLRWIDSCGHAPMMEQPDQFVQLLDTFFSRDGYLEQKVDF